MEVSSLHPQIAASCSLTLTDPLAALLVNLNQFRLLRVVGKGAFGKVRIVERKDTNLTFALKYIRKDEGIYKIQSQCVCEHANMR
jgi:serine/threonine protein kinase